MARSHQAWASDQTGQHPPWAPMVQPGAKNITRDLCPSQRAPLCHRRKGLCWEEGRHS